MDNGAGAARATMSLMQGCLVVSMPNELTDVMLRDLRIDLPAKVHATRVRGVILDMSAVSVLDTFTFNCLADITKTVGFLGSRTVWVELQPGVVSALVNLGVTSDDLQTARTMDDGVGTILDLGAGRDEPDLAGQEPENDDEDWQGNSADQAG